MTAKTPVNEVSPNEVDLIGREAAYLSTLEIGLGSLLHGLHVPFTGYFLSLNQGFFLSRAVAQGRSLPRARLIPVSISSIAALLKSLSPAGKKLTPMLAISMQGTLFTLGTVALGPSLAGVMVGSVLSSLWAFAQPLILYSVLYGQNFARIANFYEEKFHFFWVLAVLIGVKAVVGVTLAVAGYLMPDRIFARYRDRLLAATPKKLAARNGQINPLRGAVGDLLNPLFICSLALTAGFFWFAEANFSEIVWQLLRPLAIGFLIFFTVRLISFDGLVARLERSRFKDLARSLATALRVIKRC